MIFANPPLTTRELDVVGEIGELRVLLQHNLRAPRRWTGSLRRQARARASQASNSIEGYVASLDDVAAIADDEEPMGADDETRRALRGYREAMTYLLQLADEDDFVYDARLLRSIHFMMVSYDLRARPGRWRIGPIYVQDAATGDHLYEGPPVEHVPALMSELVQDLQRSDDRPVLVRAAMAHLQLVMIHPFRDGNGRMARALQTLVLARERVLEPEFCSIEEYLGRNTAAYYRVLANVGGGHWDPQRDALPWVHFALTAHLRQARTLLRRVREAELLWAALEELTEQRRLPARSVGLLFDAAMGYRLRNGGYRKLLLDTIGESISEQVASRDLKQLVDARLLDALGEKRGRHYVAADTLLSLRGTTRSSASAPDDDPFGTGA